VARPPIRSLGPTWDAAVVGGVFERRPLGSTAPLGLCFEVFDHALIFVPCFAQLLDVVLGDVLPPLRTCFKQLKARRLAVPELPFATLLLPLEIFDKVHDDRANYTLLQRDRTL